MKMHYFFSVLSLIFISCSQSNKNDTTAGQVIKPDTTIQKTENPSFFPVTSYIQGQIFEIKNKGINPKKIINSHNRVDSSWIKTEMLGSEMAEFLSPVIDTANLITLFAEKKFLDQTLDAITLTYDPIKSLPDTFSLQHWDVYIDPNTNAVTRIYLVKKIPNKKIKQLTWVSGKRCRIVTIADDYKGNSFVENDITINWDL